MITSVLVPVDCSKYSEKALRYAVGLVKSIGAKELIVLHVIDSSLPYFERLKKELEREAEDILNEACNICRSLGVTCKKESRIGIPFIEIMKVAKEMGVDLIVIAQRSRSLKHHPHFIGSTAERVAVYSSVNVLLVKT